MAANAEIFFEHDGWGRALAWSAGLHVGITAALLLYSTVFTRSSGGNWGAGGGFGTRFAWYVQGVQRKVSENWMKYEVDTKISTAQRVYITFDIARDGHPLNVQVEQSSGVPSLDISASRAIQRIDTFGAL